MKISATVVLSILAFACTTGATATEPRPLYKNCVAAATEDHDLPSMLRAVWVHQIPSIFASVNHVQHRNEPVTQRNTFVVEAIDLFIGYATPESARLRTQATEACGARLARASWALRLYFSEPPVQNTTHLAFVARTPKGWRIWLAV